MHGAKTFGRKHLVDTTTIALFGQHLIALKVSFSFNTHISTLTREIVFYPGAKVSTRHNKQRERKI